MSRCQRAWRAEGHIPGSVADWGIGGSVIVAGCGSIVRSFGQWAAANCAALPTANDVLG